MTIKWGVLGTAAIAAGCTIPGMKQAEGCELYAIAGRNEQKVQTFKEQFGFSKGYIGYDALLADEQVQAVYIPLPNNLHYEWVMKAIAAGKHVLCEKPLALNLKEAEEMYTAAKEKGVILAEAYAYLNSPYVKALKEDVRSGIIGEVDYVETAFLTQGYSEDIRLYKPLGGGAMYDLGCYCTTMILSLLDANSTWIQAGAEMSVEGVDTMTTALIKFDNGARASFTVGMMLGIDTGERMDRLYIRGSKGHINSFVEYNQSGELEYTIVADGKEMTRKVTARQNYALEVEQVNKAITGSEDLIVTPEFSMKNAKLMEEILKKIGY
ncbi:MAG: Gfo/Idh/MocA family oxidoreductase [Lachnospiraceae bacterium]|nr:Gfo/Idh/MocA family oxidoreductase [Lachnospiraceae bacterium]